MLGYTFSCVVVHLVMNQLILWFGYEDIFYKPDLSKLLKPIIESVQNEQILWVCLDEFMWLANDL